MIDVWESNKNSKLLTIKHLLWIALNHLGSERKLCFPCINWKGFAKILTTEGATGNLGEYKVHIKVGQAKKKFIPGIRKIEMKMSHQCVTK